MISEISDVGFSWEGYSLKDENGRMEDREVTYLKGLLPFHLEDSAKKSRNLYRLNHGIKPCMTRCSRDVEVEVYYQDKDGNKYGARVKFDGEKERNDSSNNNESSGSNQTTSDPDNRADSRDRDFDRE